MSIAVFAAVLFSAFLHAGWNALVKTGESKTKSMFVMTASQGLIGFLLIPFFAFPPGPAWPYIIASAVIHVAYNLFLALAYEQGDLSRVYPISRGAAPIMVLIAGVFLLPDEIKTTEIIGIIIIGFGILMMARGVFTNGESRRLLPWALAAAVTTAAYSLIDGVGARLAENAVQYLAWMFAMDAVLFAALLRYREGAGFWRVSPSVLKRNALAGLASLMAYTIVVWAMTAAPIALVTALRETSILFAVLLGILIFGERVDRAKIVAACLIVAGAALTRF